MQCVILAGGEGVRMRPLTEHTPKTLLEVADKPIFEHIVSALPEEIDELVVVVGYLGERIQAHCGDRYFGRPVVYVEQENPKAGTGDALFTARDVLHDTFLVMYGDDIHGAEAIKEAVQHEHCFLVAHSDHPEKFGVIEKNPDGTLKGIIEKPEKPPTHLVNIGGFVLTPEIFEFKTPKSEAGEYYLTDNITAYTQKYPVMIVEQDLWIPIGCPEDIEKAEKILKSRI